MHELEIVNGEAAMAYRQSSGVPWHGLGVPVEDNMTPMEMMKAANLDWKVSKQPSFVEIEWRERYLQVKKHWLEKLMVRF
jgi:hypothetical protein